MFIFPTLSQKLPTSIPCISKAFRFTKKFRFFTSGNIYYHSLLSITERSLLLWLCSSNLKEVHFWWGAWPRNLAPAKDRSAKKCEEKYSVFDVVGIIYSPTRIACLSDTLPLSSCIIWNWTHLCLSLYVLRWKQLLSLSLFAFWQRLLFVSFLRVCVHFGTDPFLLRWQIRAANLLLRRRSLINGPSKLTSKKGGTGRRRRWKKKG